MAGAFPLAIYTASHGLSWTYLRSAIDYAALDRCRKLLGPLPDFDAGEAGYEGVAADGVNAVAIAPREGAAGKALWCEIALKGK